MSLVEVLSLYMIKAIQARWNKAQYFLSIINLFYYATETLITNIFLLNNTINLSKVSGQQNIFSNSNLLEQETNAVVEYKAQIDYFLARYNNYDNYLAPQSLRVWREIEELWEATDRQMALKDQLKMTDQIYARLNTQISALQHF